MLNLAKCPLAKYLLADSLILQIYPISTLEKSIRAKVTNDVHHGFGLIRHCGRLIIVDITKEVPTEEFIKVNFVKETSTESKEVAHLKSLFGLEFMLK